MLILSVCYGSKKQEARSKKQEARSKKHFLLLCVSFSSSFIGIAQTDGQVLTRTNGGSSWEDSDGNGIYSGNGTIKSDRVVNADNKDITFENMDQLIIENANSDNVFNIDGPNNQIGIGIGSNLLGNLHINNTDTTTSLYLNNDLTTPYSNTYGIINENNSNTDNTKYGIENIVTDLGEGTRYGIYNTTFQNSNSNSAAYGMYNHLRAYGQGVHHSLRSTLSLEGIDQSLNNAAGYFLINVSNTENTSTVHGIRTRVDYLNGDRYGSHTHMLTDNSTTGGTVFSTYNLINGDGNRTINAVFNDVKNQGSGTKYGVYNDMGSTDGVTYGVYNNLNGVNNNHKYGSYNTLTNGTNGSVGYGVYSYVEPEANNTSIQHGIYTKVSSNGTGIHYGIYTDVEGSDNFGIYSRAPDASSYAGYFVGKVSSRDMTPTADDMYDLGSSSFRWEDVYATNGVIQTSDINDKTNIKNINYGLSTVMNMRPISYEWKSGKGRGKKLGFIAQDLLEILPEVVKTKDFKTIKSSNGDTIKYKDLKRIGVYYSDIIPVLTKAIQDQQKIIEKQGLQIHYLLETLKLSDEFVKYSFSPSVEE